MDSDVELLKNVLIEYKAKIESESTSESSKGKLVSKVIELVRDTCKNEVLSKDQKAVFTEYQVRRTAKLERERNDKYCEGCEFENVENSKSYQEFKKHHDGEVPSLNNIILLMDLDARERKITVPREARHGKKNVFKYWDDNFERLRHLFECGCKIIEYY